MRVMHAVSLDVARQQHRGGLQQSAWPWVATSPSFAEVFHATCEKEIPGLDCVTAAAQLQAMSSALVQRGPVSGSGLPRYHRAACGAMQLLSKGGAAPAEPKTQRAQVRQALEVALAEEGPEHSLHEPEALRAHGSSVPMPSSQQVNALLGDVEWWVWYFGNNGAVRNTVSVTMTAPLEAEKAAACRNDKAYLREVGVDVGAVLSAGGSLGVGYGPKSTSGWADHAYIFTGGYYTLCAGVGVDAKIQPAGISSSTMNDYGSIEGLSMVYSAEACVAVCGGGSWIYCVPWDLSEHKYCGWGIMTGAGGGVTVGWDTCVTRPVPSNVYKPTEGWISCPSDSWWR